MKKFSAISRAAFAEASTGQRDLSKWIGRGISSLGNDLTLELAIRSWGRYALRIHLPAFDIYGSPVELFKLGCAAWMLGTSTDSSRDYCIHLAGSVESEFPAIVLSCYRSSKESDSIREDASSTKMNMVLPQSHYPPGVNASRAGNLAFGVFDSHHLGFIDELKLRPKPERAMVITASYKGMQQFAKRIMSFAAQDNEEFRLSHDGFCPSICRFSYEANFYKTGSFGGDSKFLP